MDYDAVDDDDDVDDYDYVDDDDDDTDNYDYENDQTPNVYEPAPARQPVPKRRVCFKKRI